ncbi:phosphatase PAP2 family protein [Oxalobacteraceae bacterium A2-2]
MSILGSLAVTGPIGVTIAAWLLLGRSWRLTTAWGVLFGAGMALVVLTKVAFLGWGVGLDEPRFEGVSGHAMRAAAVFPVAAYLAFRSRSRTERGWALAAGVLLAVLISISRVKVHAHAVSECVTGTLLGLSVSAAFIWLARGEGQLALSRVLVALCLPVLLIAPRVDPLPTEDWMVDLALFLSGREQPYRHGYWDLPVPRNAMR